jgi:sugar transferase (PEP-CTERM/EpsH1 system associated)
MPPLVVHIIYELGTGGMENGLVNIINRSDPARYRHAIVCLTRAGEFARRISAPGVEIVTLDKRPGNDPGLFWRLWRALRRLRPALIHTRNLAAFEMQALGPFLPGVRRIHGEHGRDIYDLDGSNRRYRLLRQGLRPLIHRYIAVSRDLADWLVDDIRVDARKVRQIYNGVDPALFRPRSPGARPGALPAGFLPDDGLLIGTVGRLAVVKDQATLLRAFAALLEAAPAWRARLRLALVGDGPLFQDLAALAEELGVRDLVWMPGDRSDIPQLLRSMDLFVLPSLAEGISNTILEAMASGLPVVATDTGGTPELIEHGVNGYLVPVGAVEALRDALQGLVGEPALLAGFGQQGRALVERRFNWDNTVESYLSVYDETMTAGRGSR